MNRSLRDPKDAIDDLTGKTQTGTAGSGAGAGAIFLIPLMPFVFPLAGAVAVASFYGLYKVTNNNSFNGFLVFVLVFCAPIAIFLYAKRWETKVAARFKLYRVFRALFRWAAVAVIAILIFSASGNRYVSKDPSPAQILMGMVIATLAQVFVFRLLDRRERE